MSKNRARALLITIMVLGAMCFFFVEINHDLNAKSEVPMTDSIVGDTIIINDSNTILK